MKMAENNKDSSLYQKLLIRVYKIWFACKVDDVEMNNNKEKIRCRKFVPRFVEILVIHRATVH